MWHHFHHALLCTLRNQCWGEIGIYTLLSYSSNDLLKNNEFFSILLHNENFENTQWTLVRIMWMLILKTLFVETFFVKTKVHFYQVKNQVSIIVRFDLTNISSLFTKTKVEYVRGKVERYSCRCMVMYHIHPTNTENCTWSVLVCWCKYFNLRP